MKFAIDVAGRMFVASASMWYLGEKMIELNIPKHWMFQFVGIIMIIWILLPIYEFFKELFEEIELNNLLNEITNEEERTLLGGKNEQKE